MPTHKLAVFVEGQTESIFARRLIDEITGYGVVIENVTLNNNFALYHLNQPDAALESYVLIVNCQGGEAVKSRIKDSLAFLESSGYQAVIGLYDLFPHAHADLPYVEAARYVGLENANIPIRLSIAVMEIEAWFLCETSHFSKIRQALTIERILQELNIDLASTQLEAIENPAKLLDRIYGLEGLSYDKKRWHTQRTVHVLDYDELCLTHRPRLPHFDEFLLNLEEFLP